MNFSKLINKLIKAKKIFNSNNIHNNNNKILMEVCLINQITYH
jgi:hypothetical protein